MSANLGQLIPELQPPAHQLLRVAGAAGLQPRITSTRRSRAEQTRLYNRYLAGLNKYPVAPPGHSAHEYGYAFDMMVQSTQMDTDLGDLGKVWESWGGVWGGAFKDPIHFEYPGFKVPRGEQTIVATEAEPSTFLERLHALTEEHPYLSFLLGFVPYVGEAEIIAEAGYYGEQFANYLRGNP